MGRLEKRLERKAGIAFIEKAQAIRSWKTYPIKKIINYGNQNTTLIRIWNKPINNTLWNEFRYKKLEIMKTLKNIALFILASIALTSCSTDNNTPVTEPTVPSAQAFSNLQLAALNSVSTL